MINMCYMLILYLNYLFDKNWLLSEPAAVVMWELHLGLASVGVLN